MKKKAIAVVLVVLVALVVLVGVGIKLGRDVWNATFIVIDGQKLRRDVTVLDFSGRGVMELEKLEELMALEELDLRQTDLTVAQYEKLRTALPGCRILWTVPFQDGYVDMDVRSLSITSLTEEDMERLAYLEKLQTVDASGCHDLEALMVLKQARPDLQINYTVRIGGKEYPNQTEELVLENADPEELAAALPYLERLQSVDASGCHDLEALMVIKQAWPDIQIDYTVRIGGKEYPDRIEELVLENADPEEVTAALPYLTKLTSVSFTGDVPENEQIYEWMCAYPDVTFLWDFEVCGVSTNSLATELILSEIKIKTVEEVESSLKYFYNLQKVEMCGCGIRSEEMDALGKRHPQTRFIWTVQVGKCTLRTDVTTFMPYQFGHKDDDPLIDRDTPELKYCTDIVCMDVGHMEIRDYSFLKNMTKMQYLVLADTKGSDFSVLANLNELVFLEVFLTTFDQTEVLAGMNKLEDLNLAWTNIDNIEPLKEMKSLKRIWLPSTRFVDELELQELQEALPDTQIMSEGTASTGHGWRKSQRYYEMRDLLGMRYLS